MKVNSKKKSKNEETKKSKSNGLDKMVYDIMVKSLSQAMKTAMDDVFKDFKI